MAWYFILLNSLLAVAVVIGIFGMHAWAIATQHRDWPGGEREATTKEMAPAPAPIAPRALEPAVGY